LLIPTYAGIKYGIITIDGLLNQGLSERYFLFGAVAYLLYHLVFGVPKFFYVFEHELLHVIAIVLSGEKVKGFKVGKDKGEVKTEKGNIFIFLFPYMIPLYTFVITLIYFIGNLIWNWTPYENVFLFLVGFSFLFHELATLEALKIRQKDLQMAGYLFSLVLILFVNVILFMCILKMAYPEISLDRFFANIAIESKDIIVAVWRQLFVIR
jgi:hypothetical protein